MTIQQSPPKFLELPPALPTHALLQPTFASRTSSDSLPGATQGSSITPLLTPTTRSEAEAALTLNSLIQTSSAAPATTAMAAVTTTTTPLLPNHGDSRDGGERREGGTAVTNHHDSPTTQSQRDGLNQPGPHVNFDNTSDANAGAEAVPASNNSADGRSKGDEDEGIAQEDCRDGMRRKPRVRFARQESWNASDMKRFFNDRLMLSGRNEHRYLSTDNLMGW